MHCIYSKNLVEYPPTYTIKANDKSIPKKETILIKKCFKKTELSGKI